MTQPSFFNLTYYNIYFKKMVAHNCPKAAKKCDGPDEISARFFRVGDMDNFSLNSFESFVKSTLT